MRKLHIGCGVRDFGDDWYHIDGADFPHIYSKDVTKLPFKDNSVGLIYSSHLIAYFDRKEIVKVLTEWKRVLVVGGKLRVATPNFEVMVDLYNENKVSLSDLLGPMYGKWDINEKTVYHKTTYDCISLEKLLKDIGFRSVQPYSWKQTEHAHIDDHSQAYMAPQWDKEKGTCISLNIECIK